MLFQMPLPYLILSNPDLFQDCKSETNQSISQLIKNQKFPSWCMLCCVSLVLKRVCVSGGLEVCLFVCVCMCMFELKTVVMWHTPDNVYIFLDP